MVNINFVIGLNPHSSGILFSKLIFLFIEKNSFKLEIIIEINIINNIYISSIPVRLISSLIFTVFGCNFHASAWGLWHQLFGG